MARRRRNATTANLALALASLAIAGPMTPAAAAPDPPWIPAVDVRVVVPEFGEFVIRLDRTRAPNAVSAFLSLTARGAYDGLMFHRTIPGFLVQTGDPHTRDEDNANDGSEVPPWRLAADSSPPTHHRGTVSMAWRGDRPETAGMQWFVLLADGVALDGKATAIGEVVEGLDVADRISQVSTFRNRRPLKPVRIATMKLETARNGAEPVVPSPSGGGDAPSSGDAPDGAPPADAPQPTTPAPPTEP